MRLKTLAGYLTKIEEWFLSALLLVMIVLACTQIVLRTFFQAVSCLQMKCSGFSSSGPVFSVLR